MSDYPFSIKNFHLSNRYTQYYLRDHDTGVVYVFDTSNNSNKDVHPEVLNIIASLLDIYALNSVSNNCFNREPYIRPRRFFLHPDQQYDLNDLFVKVTRGTSIHVRNGKIHSPIKGVPAIETDGVHIFMEDGLMNDPINPCVQFKYPYTDEKSMWFLNGKIHRDDGPASILCEYYTVNTIVIKHTWFKSGEPCISPGGYIAYESTKNNIKDDECVTETVSSETYLYPLGGNKYKTVFYEVTDIGNKQFSIRRNEAYNVMDAPITDDGWNENKMILHREDGPGAIHTYGYVQEKSLHELTLAERDTICTIAESKVWYYNNVSYDNPSDSNEYWEQQVKLLKLGI